MVDKNFDIVQLPALDCHPSDSHEQSPVTLKPPTFRTNGLLRYEMPRHQNVQVERNLCNTFTITKVYKNKTAMITTMPNPTSKGNFLTNLVATQLAAGVCMHTVVMPICILSSVSPRAVTGNKSVRRCGGVDGTHPHVTPHSSSSKLLLNASL